MFDAVLLGVNGLIKRRWLALLDRLLYSTALRAKAVAGNTARLDAASI